MSRSDPERLRDILECVEAIDRAEVTVARYPGDPDVAKIALDAVQSRVFTIGESVKGLSLGLRQRYPDVPWCGALTRMRDLIGHHYYKLDPQIVRATIGAPVERLRAACKAILAEPVGEAEVNE